MTIMKEQDNNTITIRLQPRPERDAIAFLANMVDMYQQYAYIHHWVHQTLIQNQGNEAEAIIQITGQGAYARLQYEQGTHRIQRIPVVPVTETLGHVRTTLVKVFVRRNTTTVPEATIVAPVDNPNVRIRTYNFPLDRATDHRVKVTIRPLADVLAGMLDPFIDALSK